MKKLKSKSALQKKYCINEKELEKSIWEMCQYYLSEEELVSFIFDKYLRKERRLNVLSQKKD